MSICGRRLLLVVLCLAISTPLGSVSGRRLRGVAGGRPSKAGLGEGAAVRNGNCDRYEVAPTVEAPPNDRYEDREWQVRFFLVHVPLRNSVAAFVATNQSLVLVVISCW